jgi:Protein of unknown function (DUF1631)
MIARQHADRLFESVRRDSITALSGLLAGFWGDIEEQVRLAAIASHDNRAIYDDRLAISLLNQRAIELAGRYRESLEQEFDRWRNPRPRSIDNKALSLMSENELETQLAGQHVVELLEQQLAHPVHRNHECFEGLGALLGLPQQGADANPIRPEAPVQALVRLIIEQELTPELRRLIFLQLEKRLSKILTDLYEKIGQMLENTVAPRNPVGPPQTQQPAQNAGWNPDGGLVESRQDPRQSQAPLGAGGYASGPMWDAKSDRGYRYRETIHEQVRAWRQSALGPGGGMPGQAPAGSRMLVPHELFGIASMLQGNDPAPFVRALSGNDARSLSAVIRAQIASGSRQLGYDPTQMRFSEVDEDAIDLVAIMLQTLAHNHAGVQRARAMYGRLVVPYLKLALSDNALFDERHHPGRRLLEALSDACDGNVGDTPQDQQTLTHAELAVDRVVEGYRDDRAIFELAASELRDHLDQQKRMRDVAEQRAAESLSGRERLHYARRAVDELLASRLFERPLTQGIAEFLTTHWRHHLVQTWLREGPDSAQYLSALAVGDGLILADAEASRGAGAQVANRLIELQTPLGRCYASCGLDASAARDSLARIVTALAFPDAPRRVHAVPADEQPLTEPADNMQLAGIRIAGGTDTLEYDPEVATRMRKLRVGQNLRLVEDDGRVTIGRIAWVSPLTSRFLIVNRRGMRKLVVSPEELATLVGKGRVTLRSSEPPFEGAMREMWQQLRQPRNVS